jgi:hypothetical protein
MAFNLTLRISSLILVHPDINLLPLDQLPVQKILDFNQPPTPVAAAYISAICRAESAQPDEHFFPTLQTRSAVDLRQCLNQCQLGSSPRSLGTTDLQETIRKEWESALDRRARLPQWLLPPQDESQHKALFRCLANHSDDISYLDSRLVLRVDTVSGLMAFGDPLVIERCYSLLLYRTGRTRRRRTMSLGTRFFRPVT